MTSEQDAANAFDLGGAIHDVRPHGQGLINDTFVITTKTGRRVILQRINHHVFSEPERIMNNLRTLLAHVQQRPTAGKNPARDLCLPEIITARDGKDFVKDANGEFWRALSFIENTRTLEAITNTQQAEEAGFALGRFHALIHDLDPARLHTTLPGFHDTPRYLARFTEAARLKRETHDNTELRHCLAFVETHRHLADALEAPRREGKLPVRPVHGDTKLNNFLFDIDSGQAVSLIDLDTVQPGLIHYDIGDCLRSCANTAGESPGDIGAVRFDLDICQSLLKSYFTEARSFLTPQECHAIYDGICLVPFELGLRFLTDQLEGNRYFKTEWPGQNLHRAQTQFALTDSIEKAEKKIRRMIRDLAN